MLEAVIFSKSLWIETEANGGHWGDRTLTRRGLVLTRRVRSVTAAAEARGLGFCTGTSRYSWNRHVRSGA
jgi:hypothetical protein